MPTVLFENHITRYDVKNSQNNFMQIDGAFWKLTSNWTQIDLTLR